ncbi:MAG TPA: hypothetical protein VG537_05600, partial [Candidatus Kapabacteria bacterium]|nr:hypothetical protein [Candidatus Kapabacteria bacterium]
MNKAVRVFAILFLTLIFGSVQAQGVVNGHWRHFRNATTPRAMIADGAYLWVAADAGLLKFDREADTIIALYSTDNSAIPADDVWKLTLDKEG